MLRNLRGRMTVTLIHSTSAFCGVAIYKCSGKWISILCYTLLSKLTFPKLTKETIEDNTSNPSSKKTHPRMGLLSATLKTFY
jgi:hypothetical protein